MAKFTGILSLKLLNEGTKSEGVYPIFTFDNDLDEKIEYALVLKDDLEYNNPIFEPFEGKMVEIEGKVVDNLLIVETIDAINIEDKNLETSKNQ